MKEHEGRRHEWLWEQANVPLGYAKNGFHDFRREHQSCEALYEAANRFVRGEAKPWLIVMGGVGSGKTHIAVAVVKTLVGADVQARYTYVPKMLDDLREGYERGEWTERWLALERAQVLVLDDFGVERRTEWALERLHEIVDYRYREGGPMMLTTNQPVKAMPERISSRLLDRDISEVVILDCPDYRRR